MHAFFRIPAVFSLAFSAGCGAPPSAVVDPGPIAAFPDGGMPLTGVLQHHNHASRDGLYVVPSLTRAAAAALHRDPAFKAPIDGPTYAQPLYAKSDGGRDLILAATEQNSVYARAATDGALVWQRSLGTPVPLSHLPCGNIDPLGITGTPAIDPVTRTIVLDTMTTPDGGDTKRHLVWALSVDDGKTRPGFPSKVWMQSANGVAFDSSVENQRGAILIQNGVAYVAWGGHAGDCGEYHGWVAAVPEAGPDTTTMWHTRARGGGSWAPSGIAGDGSSIFVATGNTMGAAQWGDGEAILRLDPGLALRDYFAPDDWQHLDDADLDIGGSGTVLVDLPSGAPQKLAVALGKNGVAYLLDRAALGGIGHPIAQRRVSTGEIVNAPTAFSTSKGTFVVFRSPGLGCPTGQSGDLTAIRIATDGAPAIAVAWCAASHGHGSPMVTTTDGASEAMVWIVGAEGDNRLHGFDGESGAVIFDGGGPADALPMVRRFQSPIAAAGRIYVAADTEVAAFSAR